MTKIQIKRAMKRELNMLNETIDWKIMRGLSYRREAGRHKFLLSRWRANFDARAAV